MLNRLSGRESTGGALLAPRSERKRRAGQSASCRASLVHIYLMYIYQAIKVIRVRTAKLFRNGDSQAVRLPKEFRFDGTEVLIKRVGSAVVLLPKTKSWDTLMESLDKFPPDFMSERGQPGQVDQRESLS